MNFWHLLLLALLQSSTDGLNSPETARPKTVEVSTEVVPLNELSQRVSGQDYVPVPRQMLKDLQQTKKRVAGSDPVRSRPAIREARYQATLTGTRLETGTLEFDLYDHENGTHEGPLLIGSTSLQQLKISDDQGAISVGSDSSRRLFVLRPGLPDRLHGTWAAEGLVAGTVVTFRLELPAATVSRIELITQPGIQVTSAGSLVMGPVADGEQLRWVLIPGDASRLSFSCRKQILLNSQGSLPLAAFTTNHSVAGDILTSRWTMRLPSSVRPGMILNARIPESLRINDVTLEDKRTVEWTVTAEKGHQTLRMVVPETSPGTTLAVAATSILPQAETWNLPMLSPSQWQSADGQHRGPILTPVSQMTVLLPPAIELDEWILVGIQERDVVTRPDQSREYQLTQFLPEASAVVRTSTSQARLSDAIVTLVEPAGRLATVRCLINVRCDGSSVVELKWPVTVGWQVIATRYASNGRSLFFEFPDAMPEAVSVPLTIHLPEALDPSASRVLEIQLQQTDTADAQTLQLPVLENPQITRTNAVVIFPPAFSLNSDLQRRWSAGRRSLGIEDVRQQMPWFPESRLVPSMQFFEGGEALTRSATETLNQENADQSSIRLEHAIRISEGLIVEVSRFVVPADTSSDQQFSVLVPAAATSDLRWSLDGEPVAARREDNLPSDRDQRRWIISLEKRRPETACILRCESRRAVMPEFVAAVPMPESTRPLKGTLQLFSSEEGLLAVGNLGQETSRELADTDNQSTLWRLPEEPTAITVRMNLNPRIQSGQTIDIHMLHLIGEHNGGLHRDVLAVANVSRSAGENMLPLSLPANTRPLVLVDGFRVQLQETADGLAVPLPQSTADCQVVLTWRESGERPDRITGERRLPRLFQSELLVPQCTHHVLVEHGLELAAPDSAFLASEPTDITRILDRFLVRSLEDGHTTQSSETMTIPPDIRQFVIRWQLAAAQGWRPQTVIDPVVAEAPIVIRVTQLRRRLAIATGTCLMLIAACIGMRQFASQHRLAAASVALGLLGISFLVASQILVAALQGAFWGLAIGLLLILVSRWRWLSRIIRNPFLRASAALIASLLIGNDAWAAPQVVSGAGSSVPTFSSGVAEGPDVLIPDTPVADSDVVYVRRTLLDNWKANQTASQAASPAAVVTSLHSKIVSDSADSIELKLSLSVAAMSSDRATTLRIPLQGSRLVECLVNGVKVLPVPDGLDSIRVDIPASTVLPQRTLEETSELASSDQQANTAVDAGPLDAFTVHEVVCRLRPLTVRQASGVQFRLPGLPCPSATVEIVSPPNLYSSARAQTPEGVMQWSPADGLMPLKSLAMSSSIDVRLFQVGIEKGSPQHAAVRILTIHETVSGQQVLNCICRFSRWNTLTPEVRYRVPQGYELVGVSATTGADVVTDLLWSVKDQNATVLLPAGVTNEFVLQLQLVSQTPVTILNQPVPIVELQQFPDCVVSPPFLLAVRANAVFSVLPVEGDQVSTVSFADLKADWGHWLLGSDSVFRIPSGNPECVVRLAPRASVNEVRVAQDVSIHEGQIDWRCRIDVETSVLPVFRHRMQISSDILITDVQVVAGEANRLDSWHRRGDQLVVQLKEGTTGLHGISIVGRQILRPDDVTLNLHSAHLQNAQILDSSMTVVDEDGLGLTFLKLGGAVPVERVNPDDMLTRGTSVRMQIVDESQPVVLQRLRPVEPVGTIAAVRSPDDVTFILHITQWSGSLGPLHMDFPDSAEFIMEPVVVASGQPLPLVREAGEFVAGQDVVRSLFDQPEFTVVWTMPIREVNASGKTASFAWPAVFDGIQWSKLLLVPLDAVPGSAEETARTESPAPWLTRAIQASGNDPSTMKLSAVSIPLDSTLAENKLTIPVNAAPDQSSAEIGRDVIAFTDTVVVCQSGQSPVGETTVVLFSSKNTPKCSLTIPDGLVITELQSLESTRWEDSARERVMIELTRPVTIIRTRWLSTKAGQQGLSDQFRILPPFPADCQLRQVMTIVSPNGQMPTIRGNVELIPRSDLLPSQMADIDVGLNHARPSEQSARRDVSDPLPSRDSIVQTLTASRDEFLQSFNATERLSDASAFLHKTDSSAVQVSIDTEPDLVAVVSMITGIFMLLLTAFTENRTRPDPAVVSGGLSQQTKITGSAVSGKDSQSESQRSASGSVPPAGQRSSVQGSGRAPSSISQSNPKQT